MQRRQAGFAAYLVSFAFAAWRRPKVGIWFREGVNSLETCVDPLSGPQSLVVPLLASHGPDGSSATLVHALGSPGKSTLAAAATGAVLHVRLRPAGQQRPLPGMWNTLSQSKGGRAKAVIGGLSQSVQNRDHFLNGGMCFPVPGIESRPVFRSKQEGQVSATKAFWHRSV